MTNNFDQNIKLLMEQEQGILGSIASTIPFSPSSNWYKSTDINKVYTLDPRGQAEPIIRKFIKAAQIDKRIRLGDIDLTNVVDPKTLFPYPKQIPAYKTILASLFIDKRRAEQPVTLGEIVEFLRGKKTSRYDDLNKATRVWVDDHNKNAKDIQNRVRPAPINKKIDMSDMNTNIKMQNEFKNFSTRSRVQNSKEYQTYIYYMDKASNIYRHDDIALHPQYLQNIDKKIQQLFQGKGLFILKNKEIYDALQKRSWKQFGKTLVKTAWDAATHTKSGTMA